MKDDTVSRAAAIDAVSRGCQEFRGIFAECEKNLNALPAVQTCDDAVSRQAAIDALMEKDKKLRSINWYDKPYAESECRGIDEALSIISNLPSAQSQITHCAECIHWKHSDVRKNYCEVFDWVNTADDFCSFAERRMGGNGRD